MSTDAVINLDERRRPVAGVITLNGEQHNVLKYTEAQYRQAASITDRTPITELYSLVRQVVPTLPPENLTLDKDQCFLITTLASQGIAAVLALFPNAPGPETPPTSPG